MFYLMPIRLTYVTIVAEVRNLGFQNREGENQSATC
jgi:hypothetical protein